MKEIVEEYVETVIRANSELEGSFLKDDYKARIRSFFGPEFVRDWAKALLSLEEIGVTRGVFKSVKEANKLNRIKISDDLRLKPMRRKRQAK